MLLALFKLIYLVFFVFLILSDKYYLFENKWVYRSFVDLNDSKNIDRLKKKQQK